MPMWDPHALPMAAWAPDIGRNLEALRGKIDSVWLSDHFIPGSPWMPPEPDAMECWAATAHFAALFPEFRFGQIVLNNSFRHPSMLAKMAATTQALTGARLILGIGAGWAEREWGMYGYPHMSAAVRLQQLGEAVQVIRRMWNDSPASFNGSHYTIDGAFCNPRPDPVPPILIGARGEQVALRIVARHGDWWECHGVSAPELRRKAGILVEHCAAVGRDPTSILYAWQCQSVALGDSEREAHALAERSPLYHHTAPDARLVGTPEQVLERLEEYVEVGVRHFILRFLDFPRVEGALRFAADVAPKLRTPSSVGGG